jgi:hypothetical protein
MTEKELSQLGLLEEFSIMELEQRLEFEAWCNGNCDCQPTNTGCTDPNQPCVPIEIDSPCVI